MIKPTTKTYEFRIHTPSLLQEIADAGLARSMGALKIPLNVLRIYLGKVAERAIKLNDPILNKIMFDMALYDVPPASSPEYGEWMNKIYQEAQEQEDKEIKEATL